VVAAEVVDHVTPHRGNRETFWNQENWQSLCKQCHDQKTRGGE
jgi:5-methylcytosine-specific restriction protein A